VSSNRTASRLGTVSLTLVFCWQWALGVAFSFILLPRSPLGQALDVSTDTSYVADAGAIVDQWRHVPVKANGEDYLVSHGKHYHEQGYYYGQKWQCVEYAKRYYKDALNHEMPDVMGHAASFLDPDIPHGELNPARGLVQYYNGRNEAPRPDDLMVWAQDQYGHIAVVTRVTDEEVEVIQQNIPRGSRLRLNLSLREDRVIVGEGQWMPIGWLRLERSHSAR
jgi:hypothetical protein